jgi:hypothetical protein
MDQKNAPINATEHNISSIPFAIRSTSDSFFIDFLTLLTADITEDAKDSAIAKGKATGFL